MSISTDWIVRESLPVASKKRRKHRSGMGFGAVLIAMPFALLVTTILVAMGTVPLFWALPTYSLLGAALTFVFAAIL